MNENQGAKGGKQDRKRVFKIKQFYIQKIKELNKNKKFKKKLKKKKLLELQLLIPTILKIIFSNNKMSKNKEIIIKKDNSSKEKKNIVINISKEKKKEIPKEIKNNKIKKDVLKDIVLITLPVPVALKKDNKDIKVSNNKIINNIKNKSKEITNEKEDNNPIEKSINEQTNDIEILEVINIEEKQKRLDKTNKEVEELTKEVKDSNKELEKYQASRIIELYEDKFKEIRLDLKNLSYEYSLIEEKYDHVKETKEADEILKRLDLLIDKVKELKSKLDIPNSDKYENNYIYELVEEYISDFNNNKAVSTIKSSDLYIDISNKIKELETEKEYLKQKTIKKKKQLSIDEEKMKEIKQEKEKIERQNEDIKKFSKKADQELEKINKKIEETVEINREVQSKLIQANNLSNNLLLLIGAEMMIPTINSAKKVAVATTIGLYVINKIFRKDKYKKIIKNEINLVDYSKEIESSLTSINRTISQLDDNLYDIGKLIYMLENDYSEYISNTEFRSLLNNLYNIKKNIEEKRDNLLKIEQEQEKNLNKNNSKIKVLEENM